MAKKTKLSKTLDEFLSSTGISPEAYAEQALLRFHKTTAAKLLWWESYWTFLAREREKKLDEIKSALINTSTSSFKHDSLSRVVKGAHTRSPLSVIGSLRIPGRFNIGDISPSQKSFPSLYLASDEETARAEKFLNAEANGEGNLSAEDMYTATTGPYLHCNVKVELSNLLDLRSKNTLKDFLKVICTIKMPTVLKRRGSFLKIKPMPIMISDIDVLMASIFEQNFTQWQTYINSPSNSQWLGFYAYLAGMQGIIYPSLRNPKGYNIAVFPENLKDTLSFVEISPMIEHVTSDNSIMNSKSYPFFMNQLPLSTLH